MRRIICAVIACISAASVCLAEAPTREPYEIVRALRTAEDSIARGDSNAMQAQAQALADYSALATGSPYSIWNRERNRLSIVVYLLSGGDGAVVRDIIATFPNGTGERKLLDGSLAYSEGQKMEAWKLLGAIEAKSLSIDTGGQIALVQAGLIRDRDKKKALDFLDLARLLAPGSLIEEAALRSQIFLVGDDGDNERFVSLSQRYFARFPNSPYAQNFFEKFIVIFVRRWLTGDAGARMQLDLVLSGLQGPDRAKIYLLLAKEALLRGDMTGCQIAAALAQAESSGNPALENRARVYVEAASLFSNQGMKSSSALEAIDPALLSPDERLLRAAALMIAAEVQAPGDTRAKVKSGQDTPLMQSAVDTLKKANAFSGKP